MNMDRFESEHRKWLDRHLRSRKGERKRRLETGHAHAEKEMLRKIWMPAFGHFEYLHPEYEVRDFFEGRRYIDFAYIRPPVRLAIEVDGYGPHLRDVSRRQFCDERIRQMHLINDGWTVIRIGYDDIAERPKQWQQLLIQLAGRLFGSGGSRLEPYSRETEIVRLALRLDRPIRLRDVQAHLQCGYRASSKLMRQLQDKGWFRSVGGGPARVHSWKLDTEHPGLPSLL